jgi:hypothetical protein
MYSGRSLIAAAMLSAVVSGVGYVRVHDDKLTLTTDLIGGYFGQPLCNLAADFFFCARYKRHGVKALNR